MNDEIQVAGYARSVVVPFPARDGVGEDRLMRAVGTLQQALAQQARAVGEWRMVLGELGVALEGLQGSLLRYGLSLHDLAAGVQQLHNEAQRMDVAPS